MALKKKLKIVGIILVLILVTLLCLLGYRLSYNKNIEQINSSLPK
ncbi:MAG: hypothetical protein WCL25_02610 [bacterium]